MIPILCGIFALFLTSHAYAASEDQRKQEEYILFQESVTKISEKYLQTENDIQHYAFLDYESASDQIRPVILAARNIIIYRHSWVADGVSGRILDRDGNVKQELPEFSDIFPEDWDEPSCPVVVDPSYYQPHT